MFKPGEIEGIPLGIEQQFSDLEMRIMEDIVRRLKANGNDITRAADWQIHRLHELGMSKREIKKQIQESLQLGDKEIDRIYSDVIKTGYQRDSSIYNFKGKNQIPYEENTGLQQLIAAVSAQTNGEFKNITQTMGFAKRENGQLKFTKLSDYYQKTLDGAMLDITSGAFDYNTVLKRVTRELTNSGLRTVDYASGKSLRVESAARMAVMTGVSQVTAQINESNAKELDTEYFEVTCHGGARPSHQEWQGKVYTKKELGTICGLGAADGLCGCNCYHDYYPFFPGISERAYTDEELKKLKKEENTPVEYNGKSYTKYEATQKQRSLERAMRAQRQQIHLLEQGGANEDDIILARGRYRATSSEYTRFSKAMKLPQQRERVTVDGLGNVGVGKYKISQKSVANSGNSGIIKESEMNSELGKFKQKIINDERMSKEYYYEVKEKFSHGSDIAKESFNKFVPADSVVNSEFEGTPHFNPNTKQISMHYSADLTNERGACATWFHEHGHMVDNLAGTLSDNEEFSKLLHSDYMEYMKSYGKSNGLNTFDKVQGAISNDLNDMRKHSAVADILEGVSGCSIQGIAGHGRAYWQNPQNLTSEAFAHMFEAQFDKVRYSEMQKYFPKSLAKFEEILKEAVKK